MCMTNYIMYITVIQIYFYASVMAGMTTAEKTKRCCKSRDLILKQGEKCMKLREYQSANKMTSFFYVIPVMHDKLE